MNLTALVALILSTILLTFPDTGRAAEPFSSDERRGLAGGEVLVRVDPDPAGASGRINAIVDIAVPPAQLWSLMTDCARSLTYVKGLTVCRVTERGTDGRTDLREQVIKKLAILPTVRTVFRSEYDEPREIRFKRVGGDLPVLEGTWTLLPLANGTRTRLVYMARLGITTVVPTAILRGLIRSEVTSTLEDLRAEAVRARKR